MKYIAFSLIFIFCTTLVSGQSMERLAYIEKYKDLAILEMNMYRIPASITLAQGILESGDGNSMLAKSANNHFGIKCHVDWNGKRVYHDDDEKGECFRKYKDPSESFRDHSLFLTGRSRYKDLFELDVTDYKGWARGLKKAGYATNPQYADILIRIIEEYQLYLYDAYAATSGDALILKHPNNVKYTVVRDGESLEAISSRTKVSVRRLVNYNDFTYESIIQKGDIIYLQPKRNRGKQKYHTVRPTESMHDVSQEYGIKLRKLYYRNRMSVGAQPETGDQLHLRWRKKNSNM
jgi:hypothetical protein